MAKQDKQTIKYTSTLAGILGFGFAVYSYIIYMIFNFALWALFSFGALFFAFGIYAFMKGVNKAVRPNPEAKPWAYTAFIVSLLVGFMMAAVLAQAQT
ncbi:hypothetical protein B0H94_10335 [Salsuginibacillus halophilus]|uniref:Uncharacterized protein n=1 Tax=Salsuginibacillus halophilus TaxID=517424 RepID=A0A2P8HW80_9BACI|nr:hypothetical protein [Salsuginibacillus halophilus]PSL50424.1 hypothetical protein B0H94_10335 [Salsuginibacillus halophilus]